MATVTTIVNYNRTVITIVNYDPKTFIVQATGKNHGRVFNLRHGCEFAKYTSFTTQNVGSKWNSTL